MRYLNKIFKKLLVPLFLILALTFVSSSQSCSLTTWDFPFADDDNYGWSCGLYLPNQVGGAQTMTEISMSLFGPSYMNHSFSNQRIYLRHTNDLEYSGASNSFPGTAGFVLVYSGTLSFTSGNGIYTFSFNENNFNYNGKQALEVLFINESGSQYSDGFELHRIDLAPSGPNIGKYGSGWSWSSAEGNSSLVPFNLALQFNNSGSPCFYPLPVELNYASIECDKNNVNLEWATFSETNNNYYEIEFSEDGKIWRNIGRVEGAGNSTEDLAYSFNLNNYQRDNVTYVRLSQVDYDGTRELLNTLSVNCNAFEREIRAYPVPFNDQVTIEAKETPTSIAITDVSGRKMNVSYTTEGNKIKINTSSLENGNYIIMLQFTSSFETLKVTKM